MAHYVDGFVVPVPKRNVDAYRRMARKAGKIWRAMPFDAKRMFYGGFKVVVDV